MSNEYLDWLNDLKNAPEGTADHNHWLCLMFPWLVPHNCWTGEEIEDFDYSWTELDAMPDGWRKAFGEQMCFEIKSVLEETKDEEFEYRILQIKEKWGYLHWYDIGAPEDIYNKLNTVIKKYEELSKRICVKCGAPATKISTGWISPWCDKCAEEIRDNFVPIDEWFKKQKAPSVDGATLHWVSIEPFGH